MNLGQSKETETTFIQIESLLGDTPKTHRVNKLTRSVKTPVDELRQLAQASNVAVRRVARIILHIRSEGYDPILLKGLGDSSALIRCDTVRLSDTDKDRTRFYNHLIKMIREDPDRRVRKAAGERLTSSFADLYSMEFQGMPNLSRMLILASLEGTSYSDEECATEFLFSSSKESAFYAARCLYKWGTLRRLLRTGEPKSLKILKRCSELGIVEQASPIPTASKDAALGLSKMAKSENIDRRILAIHPSPAESVKSEIFDITSVKKLFWDTHSQIETNRDAIRSQLPIKNTGFRRAMEMAFPPPDNDISSVLLFEIVKQGNWAEWSPRIANALTSQNADIRISAAKALSRINPGEALDLLPPLLWDTVSIVRETAKECLEEAKRVSKPVPNLS